VSYPNELMIGNYADGVSMMVAISTLGRGDYSDNIAEGAFTVDPVSYSKAVQAADGSVRLMGWMECAWHISGLRAEQYDGLIAYKTGTTIRLYIRTLSEDGATYKNYSAKAIFPPRITRGDPTAVEDGPVLDFEIRFIQLVEIP
jgi:hypothetical protein